MRLRGAHIVVLAFLMAMLCGCNRRARIIPADKFSRIYQDMFVADQWIRDHPDARPVADTTLVFDPIFSRYGYSFEDYDRSVHYYLDRPEQYSKILDRVSERLHKEGERLQQAADVLTAREVELSSYRKGFVRRNFSTDSLRWSGIQAFWPVSEVQDSVATDSLRVPLPIVAPLETKRVYKRIPADIIENKEN
ncbi:MAG: DUF4296 domain-containing protein [Bacteroidales bacterium]|nr:DUF4296 domain-containing protein [Bacteroidales bacterium]